MSATFDSDSAEVADRYPALRDDLRAADDALAEASREAGRRARTYQRKFRRAELAIIWGGVAAVGLGAVAGITDAPYVSLTESLLAGFLGALAFVAGSLKWHQRWLGNRWQAESLRGERFLFVGRLGRYAGDVDRASVARVRVVEIEDEAQGDQADE
jgi:hypothetical protein